VENHAHFHGLTRPKTYFPIRLQVDVTFCGKVLDNKFPLVNFLSAVAMLPEIDSENRHQCLLNYVSKFRGENIRKYILPLLT
jgi:hypothetical protein